MFPLTFPADLDQLVKLKILPAELRDKVVYSAINQHETVLIVTRDDEVHAMGANSNGQLGLGHTCRLKMFKQVPDLSGKRIKEFFFGVEFVVALTHDSRLFSWGKNDYGQLGRGYRSTSWAKFLMASEYKECLTPRAIDYFNERPAIRQFLVLNNTCFAVLTDGVVYMWGRNNIRWIGAGLHDYLDSPTRVDALGGIAVTALCIYINRREMGRFFILDQDGKVYWHGNNTNSLLKIRLNSEQDQLELSIIESLPAIQDIRCTEHYTYFLTANHQVYSMPIDTNLPNLVNIDAKIMSIQVYEEGKAYATDHNHMVHLFDFEQPVKSQFNDIANHPRYRNHMFYVDKEQHKNLTKKNTTTGKQMDFFIAGGGYGRVNKLNLRAHYVTRNGRAKRVALKKILLPDSDRPEDLDKYLRELQIMKNFDSDYVAKLYDFWIDQTSGISSGFEFIYMHIEFCEQSLKEVIDYKTDNVLQSTVDFVISCEILRQLLEAINYVHTNGVIHRDLKPANVLVKYSHQKKNNVRHNHIQLKLCDFGLAKSIVMIDQDNHQHSENIDGKAGSNTTDLGTPHYQAPEITTSNYNEKVDIFSLGVMTGEIFCQLFKFENYHHLNLGLSSKVEVIKQFQEQMILDDSNLRPSCSYMLNRACDWSFSYLEIRKLNLESSEKPDKFQFNFIDILTELSMPPLFNELKIFSRLTPIEKNAIKYYTVFKNSWSFHKHIVYVTKDDTVFCLKDNTKVVELKQLHYKQIIAFFVARDVVLALSVDNSLYSIKFEQDMSKVININYDVSSIHLLETYSKYKITQISIGRDIAWILLDNNVILNITLQDNSIDELTILNKYLIKQIFVNYKHQSYYIITHQGEVYSWGDNPYYILGHGHSENVASPRLVENLNQVNIVKLISSRHKSYFLSEDGDLYFCGRYKDIFSKEVVTLPTIVPSRDKFRKLEILNKCDKIKAPIALGESNVYELGGMLLSKTECRSIEEYSVRYCQTTFQTYEI